MIAAASGDILGDVENRFHRICAWCKRPLSGGATTDSPISHGICEACASFVLADKLGLKDFLETIDAPVLAVDEEGRAITVNGPALRVLGKESAHVEGRLGGQVMECDHARLPEGCGKTIHCSGCQIRMSVNHTRRTGEPLIRARAFMSIQTPDGVKEFDYFVSTERLETGVTLLRIDDRRPAA